jgi:hypothetical protein
MLHDLFFQKGADLRQFPVDGFIRIKDKLPCKKRDIRSKTAVIIHRAVDVEPVPDPGFIVLLAMARSRMNTARASIQGDIGSQDEERFAVEIRMAASESLKRLTLELFKDPVILDPEFPHGAL